MYVNLEHTLSKTDHPMIWNKPPQQVLDKYRKGVSISSLFPCEEQNINDDGPFRFEDVESVTGDLLEENSLFSIMYRAEIKCNAETEKRKAEEARENEKLAGLLNTLYSLQMESHETYNYYENVTLKSGDVGGFRLRLRKRKCSSLHDDRFNAIEVDKNKWFDICFMSKN